MLKRFAMRASSSVTSIFYLLVGHHHSAVAWMVLAASAVVSVFAWDFSKSAIERAAEGRFDSQITDTTNAIVNRMNAQQVALKGGVGLFNASNAVTREEWRNYFHSLRAKRLLPGLQGFGYSLIIAPENLGDHVKEVRREGFDTYDVHPQGARETYTSVLFLEPFNARNRRAFGYDMMSEATRRAAMERARDTGETSVSGMVKLLQETNTDIQPGFLMYIPHFKTGMPTSTIAERRAAIQGFVYSPFRIKDLMSGILGLSNNKIEFKIFDGTIASPDRLLYDSDNSTSPDSTAGTDAPVFEHARTVSIHGHPWKLVFTSHHSFASASESMQPIMTALAAIIIDTLLFCTISALSQQKSYSMRLAKKRTRQLAKAKKNAEAAAERETVLRVVAQESNQRLGDANKGLTRFASIVAHDLRAPLKRLESFVEILEEDYRSQLDADGVDVVQRISRSAVRMRMMLDSLHDYTRISNLDSSGKRANLYQTIQEVVEGSGPDFATAEFSIEVDPDLWVVGDTYLLQHVVQNLISNAIKFQSDAEPQIVFSTQQSSDQCVVLAVADNGIGIDPKYADTVFDMFTRLHNEDEYEGTGIGLAVCKKIVVDHGGDVVIDKTCQSGTRVLITLLRSEADIQKQAA